jgi:hypothetical protein
MARVEFHLPQGTARPVLEKAPPPKVSADAAGAAATFMFDIDDRGVPVNIRAEKGSAEDWARDVTEALSKWRFAPASNNSGPVSVPCTMEFRRGS